MADCVPQSSLLTPIPKRVYRGRMAHAISVDAFVFWPDGGLVVNADGVIEAFDDWQALAGTPHLHGAKIVALPSDALVLPGFVDLHVHLPQMEVTGHQADTLLQWLETHIFRAEARFSDAAYAHRMSQWFFQQLLRNGTTTAAVFLTSHPEAVQIAFETALAYGNRVVMGQNLMDCNAPPSLVRPTDALLAETERLCNQWHHVDQGRISYAWMPRFALTSSEALLRGLEMLRQQYPDVYLHTHLSEQPSEIEAVLRQFPWAKDYTAVYERFALLREKTILAHGIHLATEERTRLHQAQAALAHCPSSNFFLKSGVFPWFETLRQNVLLGFGSDVGAGPELSLFKVMKDAQYMQSSQWIPLSALFYTATLGGAVALGQGHRIGNFQPGKEADFIVLTPQAKSGWAVPASDSDDPNGSPPLESLFEPLLSRLIYLGDEQMMHQTYIRGRCVYSKGE